MIRHFVILIPVAAFAASLAAGQGTQPRPPGSTRTDLQRHDLSIPGWEMIQARVDFAPGASFPSHRHPGEEIIYVLQGRLEYQLEGRQPVIVEAGQVLFVPNGVFHSARNVDSTPGSELATYVVEKGRPLVEFAR